MKFKKVIVTLIGVFFIAGFSSQAMAAFEPGDDDNLVGPVLWAVGVINCSNGCTGTLRTRW